MYLQFLALDFVFIQIYYRTSRTLTLIVFLGNLDILFASSFTLHFDALFSLLFVNIDTLYLVLFHLFSFHFLCLRLELDARIWCLSMIRGLKAGLGLV